MMKIGSFTLPGYFVALLGISIAASAAPLQVEYSDQHPPMSFYQQSSETDNSGNVEGADAQPTDEELKKKCAMARKNVDILKSSGGTKTFRTSKDEIVMYTPDEIKQMIKDNESVIKEECS